MSSKILVTGATGNIGKEIVKLLKDKNITFNQFVHDNKSVWQ